MEFKLRKLHQTGTLGMVDYIKYLCFIKANMKLIKGNSHTRKMKTKKAL